MNIIPAALLFILFSVIILLVGLYLILSGVLIQKTWIQTYADIQSSDIESAYDSDNELSYWPRIKYSYRYNNKEYICDCYQSSFSDYEGAENFVKKTTVKNRVEIYVNPSNPGESKLKAEINPFTFLNLILLAIGVLLTVISIATFYVQSQINR